MIPKKLVARVINNVRGAENNHDITHILLKNAQKDIRKACEELEVPPPPTDDLRRLGRQYAAALEEYHSRLNAIATDCNVEIPDDDDDDIIVPLSGGGK